MFTGKELKLIRIKNDVKLYEVAKKLSISDSYVSLVENGKRPVPKDLYEKWISVIGG